MLWALFLIFHGTHAEPIKVFDDYKVCSNLAEILSEAKEKKLIARADLDYICLPLPSEKLIAEVEENILFAEAKKSEAGKIGSYPFVNISDGLIDEEVKVVNFFASWSPPSKVEAPNLQKLKNKGVKIYGIAIKDTEANAIQYLDKQNPYSAVALDETGMIAQLYGVEAPPATFILSKKGVVLYKSAGPLIGDSSTNNFLFQLETALSQ